jgi:hypothetical protein
LPKTVDIRTRLSRYVPAEETCLLIAIETIVVDPNPDPDPCRLLLYNQEFIFLQCMPNISSFT